MQADLGMCDEEAFFMTQYDLLIFTILWANSADNELIFSYFSQTTGFHISCKLSPLETICIKCQILFSAKNKKNIIKY